MKGNFHVRFLGGKGVAILPTYPLSYSLIDGGDGNDTILNKAGHTLWNYQTQTYEFFKSSNVTINGGNGDDKISTSGEKITIDAGSDEGCDTVVMVGKVE